MQQSKIIELLNSAGGSDRKIESDNMGTPIIWAKDNSDLLELVKLLEETEGLEFSTLSDLTAYENSSRKDGPFDFVMVYQLFSMANYTRIRIKLGVNLDKDSTDGFTLEVPSLTFRWRAANWLEREVFDMYGIKFSSHPDLRRILMDERWKGFPLRKNYDMRDRQEFLDSSQLKILGEDTTDSLSDCYNPNILMNLGPSHPAMHGTLRVMCRVNGEVIENATCELGYLHRAIEKLGEEKTYHQWIVYTDRLNYCSALNNNVAYCMAVENVLGITVTERCQWVRVICMELARIIDHIICVAVNALDLGAMTVFWYLYHWREEVYTMIEAMCGMRLTTSYARIGGMSHDLPENFDSMMKKFLNEFPKAIDEVEALLTKNRIWVDRTRGVGKLTREEALSFSITGPCLRASNINVDLRRDAPYYTYPELDFDVPIGVNGDVYDRYLVRIEEMRQSVRILKQCMNKLPKGDIWVDDPKIRIPSKQDVYTKMESLIHHFKIFMEGIDVPEGEGYSCVEGPNGELGFYIVSRGGPKAHRLRIKSPSFLLFQSFEYTIKNSLISDAIANLGSVNIIAGELDR